jgi:hypothetical protein
LRDCLGPVARTIRALYFSGACRCVASRLQIRTVGDELRLLMARDSTRGIGWANGLSLGIVIGSSIGLLWGNFLLGMAIAIGVGGALGAVFSRATKLEEPTKRVRQASLGRK